MQTRPRTIQSSFALAQDIYEHTMTHGGDTYHLTDGRLVGADLWAVSVVPARSRVVPLDQFTQNAVASFILGNLDYLDRPGDYCVGTWVSDGQVYLDLSVAVPDREDALWVAERQGQLAIYHLGTGEEVSVPAAARAN